jgi:hypothetical protein
VINPGARPIEVADEEAARELAEQNLQAFVDEMTERGAELVGEPERDLSADEGGRYAWVLPLSSDVRVPILMPGVPLEELKGMSVRAPCLRVDGLFWWWNDAVNQAVPLSR